MSDFNLEVGKSYVAREAGENIIPYPIVGEIVPGTWEYSLGYRFFDCFTNPYKSNGEILSGPKDRANPWKGRDDRFDLIREVRAEDLKDRIDSYLHYSKEDLEDRTS